VSHFVRFTTTLHGADAGQIRLRHDETHNALYLELAEFVDFRFDRRTEMFGQDRTDEIRRDRDGLLHLAEAAMQAASKLGQLLPPEAIR